MRSKVGLAILGKRQMHRVMQKKKIVFGLFVGIYKGVLFILYCLFLASTLAMSCEAT